MTTADYRRLLAAADAARDALSVAQEIGADVDTLARLAAALGELASVQAWLGSGPDDVGPRDHGEHSHGGGR